MAKLVSQNTNMLPLDPGDKHFLCLNGLEQAKWKSGSESIHVMLLPVSYCESHMVHLSLPSGDKYLDTSRKRETSL